LIHMKQIVYSTSFYCHRCENDTTINLFSDDSDFEITEEVKKETESWGKHYHWVDNHQICAICGELVETRGDKHDLDLIQTEVMRGAVHPLYLKWELNPDRGLLTVHKECSKKMFSDSTQ